MKFQSLTRISGVYIFDFFGRGNSDTKHIEDSMPPFLEQVLFMYNVCVLNNFTTTPRSRKITGTVKRKSAELYEKEPLNKNYI